MAVTRSPMQRMDVANAVMEVMKLMSPQTRAVHKNHKSHNK